MVETGVEARRIERVLESHGTRASRWNSRVTENETQIDTVVGGRREGGIEALAALDLLSVRAGARFGFYVLGV